jgi:hypothetical protein
LASSAAEKIVMICRSPRQADDLYARHRGKLGNLHADLGSPLRSARRPRQRVLVLGLDLGRDAELLDTLTK